MVNGFTTTFKSGRQFAVLYHEDAYVLLSSSQPTVAGECCELLQRGLGRSSGRQLISVISKHDRMPLVEMLQT